jgi:hypothetical protein
MVYLFLRVLIDNMLGVHGIVVPIDRPQPLEQHSSHRAKPPKFRQLQSGRISECSDVDQDEGAIPSI